MSETLELSKRAPKGADPANDVGDAAPPPPPGVKWRIKVGDKEYGPYPRTRLIDFLKEGRVGPATLLCCGTDTEFVRADRHVNLRWDFSPARKRKFGEVKLEPGETEVPICNYVVAARLLSTNGGFERALMESGKMARCAGDIWVLRSKLTVQQLRHKLSMIMHKDEQVVIVNASKDRLAWFNLGPESDIAVRDVWDSDEVV
jgi:hypothetical protein